MPESVPDVSRVDGRLMVEARSASDALGAVASELGTNARIVAVDKVLRGGIAGFFAREMIQVIADIGEPDDERPAGGVSAPVGADQAAAAVEDRVTALRRLTADGGAAAPAPSSPALRTQPGVSDFSDLLRQAALQQDPPTEASWHRSAELPPRRDPEFVGTPVAIALDRLLRQTATLEGENFGQALRAELSRAGWRPEHGNPAHARIKRVWAEPVDAVPDVSSDVSSEPSVEFRTDNGQPSAPSQPSEPAGVAVGATTDPWSIDVLGRLGLPPVVLEAVEDLDPGDPQRWVEAIATCVEPLCTPLPLEDCAYVGPGAATIADPSISTVSITGQFRAAGDICIPVGDSGTGRSDVGWLRDGRWLHVVVGEGSWRGLLDEHPTAVSWVHPTDLPTAITVAFEHGLALGSSRAAGGQRHAADPMAVATAIAELVADAAAAEDEPR